MSKTKKIISLVLVAMLVMAMATVAIVSTSALDGSEVHYVAGDEKLCGSAWQPTDANNQMTWNADKGVLEKIYTNVAAGTYEFKVTSGPWDSGEFNLTGDASFGGANAIAEVLTDGSTVIIGFDGTKALLEIVPGSDEPIVEPTTNGEVQEPTTAPTPVVPGDGITVYFTNNKGWAAVYAHAWDGNGALDAGWPGTEMTFVETNEFGENIYKITVPATATGVVFNGGVDQPQTTDVTPENGKGYYCTEQDAEGKWAVESYDYNAPVVEPTTVAPVETTVAPVETTVAPVETTVAPVETTVAPVETTVAPVETTVAPVETTVAPVETTVAPVETTVAPVTGNGVNCGGQDYLTNVGDVLTYTFTLTTPAAVENVQASVYYDAEKLELINDKSAMFPNLTSGLIYNVNVPGVVKFNASEVMEGFDFTAGATLVTLRFNVLDTTYSELYTELEEMVELMGDDYVTGGDIMVELGVAETLTGNTGTDQPTTTAPTQPTTTIPGGQPTTTIPGGQTTTTAPVVPGTTANGSTPAPNTTDAQGSTGTNGGGNGTVTTGAATFIYVAIAVLSMAAVAVVVLRKRVNG